MLETRRSYRLDTIPERDGITDRQTDGNGLASKQCGRAVKTRNINLSVSCVELYLTTVNLPRAMNVG